MRPVLGEKVQARGTLGGVEPRVPATEPLGLGELQLPTTHTTSGTPRSRPGAPRLRLLPAPSPRLRRAIG